MSRMPVTFQERVPVPLDPLQRSGGGATAAFSVGDVIGAIKQRIFLILFVWLLLIGATVAGTWLWQKYAPSWRATAYVVVESPQPTVPLTFQQQPVAPEIQERNLKDQAVLVESQDVLAEALKDAAVLDTQWYKEMKRKDRATVEELRNALAVAPLAGTSYLSVSISCKDPGDPHMIVNAVVEKYLARVKDSVRKRLSAELDEYEEQLRNKNREIQLIREFRRNFMLNLGVPGVMQGLNTIGDTLKLLNAEATRLQMEKIQFEETHKNLEKVSANELVISPQMRLMIENDPRIARLNDTYQGLQQAREMNLKQFGPGHRAVREIEDQMAIVQAQLTEERAAKEHEVRQYELDQALMAYLTAAAAELGIRERLVEVEDKQRDLDRNLVEYEARLEDQRRLEEDLKNLSDYTNMLRLMRSQSTVVRVDFAAKAQRPVERSLPRWSWNIPAGTFLGLVAAVGLALLLEFIDTSVRTPRDIVRHVSVPMLGTVPDVDDEEVAIDRVELAAHVAPQSMIAEAFRNIRTNLSLSAPAERQRTVLVASPKPEDGKTTIAVNLAIAIAKAGRRVLLIDANFRRSRLHQLFPNQRREGLSNALIGQGRLEELAHTTELPNLDVLFAGPTPPNPAELLSSEYMRSLIAQATERYDQVILDGPPVLLVSDALVLASMVDGVILVCRAKVNSRGVAQRARDQLARVNAHLFGAVLNAAQVRRGGYFREQLRTYYEYQPEELAAGGTAALPGGKADGGSAHDEA